MSKAVKMAKVSAKGGFHLFLGMAVSSLISAAGTIIIIRLLTPAQYGLYTKVLTVPAMLTLFQNLGVNQAVIKFLSQFRSQNRPGEARKIVGSGLFFQSLLSAALFLVAFSLSGVFAQNVFGRPEIQPLIQLASFAVLANVLFYSSSAVFTGYERMEYVSLVKVVQSIAKSVLTPLLIILGYGVFGALLGYVGGGLATSTVVILVAYYFFYRKTGPREGSWEVGHILKMMLTYGVPLSLSLLVSGFLTQFYNFLAARYVSDILFGNYQAANNFTVLITFFTMPVTQVLFPAFSKLNPDRESETLRTVFQASIKYGALLVVPASALVITVSHSLVYTLFGSEWLLAPVFLSLICLRFLYSGVGNLTFSNLLKGQGKTKQVLFFTLASLGLGLPLSLILIPLYGIYGLIFTTLVAPVPSLVLMSWWVKKNYGFTVKYTASAKIYIASALAAAPTSLLLRQCNLPSWMELALGSTVFLVIYLVAAPLIGALQQNDIINLKKMTGHLGPFTYLLHLLLDITQKIRNFKTG
ncbi:MAG: flippase [Thermoproteota archaeon]